MSLRLKLLTPILLFTLVLLGVVIFIFVDNYNTFLAQTQQQTALDQANISEIFNSHVRAISGFVMIIKQNQVVADSTIAGSQINALNVISPIAQQTDNISFINLYYPTGEVFLQSRDPGAFGKPDALKPLVDEALSRDKAFVSVQDYEGQLALLGVSRLDGVSGPAGVAIVGYFLDSTFVKTTAALLGRDIAISYGGQLIASSLATTPTGTVATDQQILVSFTTISSPKPFALVLLLNNAQAVQRFWSGLAVVLLIVLLASGGSVAIAVRILNAVVARIDQTLAVLRRVENGNFGARIEPPISADEIGMLQKGVNSTAEQLENSFNTLEQRVVERTAELAIARDQAVEATRAKSRFFAHMSHELRTPLNAVLGFAQLMERDSALNASHRERLAIISRSGEHLLGLINNVLEMSKIEAGQIAFNPSAFDLPAALGSVIEIMQARAAAKRLQLLLELDPKLPRYVTTDESKVRQILINLIGNAIKFTDEGGITLRVRGQETGKIVNLWLEIEDTGVGIAEDQIATLFTAFAQTDSGKHTLEGTGLGLSISRQFAQLMGGDITVRSIVGQGTIFTVTLKAEMASGTDLRYLAPRRKVLGLAPGLHDRHYRVLVVDDKPENRLLLREWLALIGTETREAANGQEAVEVSDQWEPHLIWMDMRMPVMDGYEATKRIKSSVKGQATTILALTASAFEHDRALILSAGCDDFVRKPVRESVFFEKMAEHLGLEFLYEAAPAAAEGAKEFELTPAELTKLPAEWVDELREAALTADVDMIEVLTNRIRGTEPAIAAAIQHLAATYRINQLQKLVQPVQEQLP